MAHRPYTEPAFEYTPPTPPGFSGPALDAESRYSDHNYERDLEGRIVTRCRISTEPIEDRSLPAEAGLSSRRRCHY